MVENSVAISTPFISFSEFLIEKNSRLSRRFRISLDDIFFIVFIGIVLLQNLIHVAIVAA